MTDYKHPYKDAAFVLRELVDFDQLCANGSMDDMDTEFALSILNEAEKLGAGVLAPLNPIGDNNPANWTEQGVQETPGFADAYKQYAEGGWSSLTANEEYGGQQLPEALAAAVNEILQSANLSFALCPLLTQGAIASINHHASAELKQQYLPKMVSGEWTGTMNLTEPDAGSDLAAVKTKATPNGDHYLIKGQKIYITWGDHQMTDNIVHLVLARLPDAPAGVKGISLFVVPKFLLDEQGNPADANDLRCVSIEHKMGIHASPTCTMSFGDDGGAVGYLVGEPHQGLMYMFTMMNHARLSVGLQGLAVSERAYQQALAYAKDRLQSTNKDGSRDPIIRFPDVRRMLMQMKAATEAMRGLCYVAMAEIDRGHMAGSPEAKQKHGNRVDLFTPIVKGWMTELAQEVTYLGMQIHGGMGFVEETGSAQHYRDARILTIYEGTTGIQAMDLTVRKTLMNGGDHLQGLFKEIEQDLHTVSEHSSLSAIAEPMQNALAASQQALGWILGNAQTDANSPGTASFHFMMLMGHLCGGWVMAKMALIAQKNLDAEEGEAEFMQAKITTAAFYCEHLLPRVHSSLMAIQAGSRTTMALPEEHFSF